MCFLLTEQWRAYRNQDGSRRKQKALPLSVLRKMMEVSTTEWDIATSWLLIGGLFFAMRSCEYLQTSADESSKRTKILRLKNIQFTSKGRRIPHDSPNLEESDMVAINFEFQKNDRRDVQIHLFRTDDKILCPVKAWAATVKRVRSYPNQHDNLTVCTFQEKDGSLTQIVAEHVRIRLRAIVDLIGEEALGFGRDDIGLHSIRSGGAMAMFLSGTSTIVIRRIGRWSSEAFLEYIREQVEDFTAGVAQRMLKFEKFHNLQQNQHTLPMHIEREDKEDGPEQIPFTIQFSDLALERDEELPQRRRRGHG